MVEALKIPEASSDDRSSGEMASHIARVAARLFAERGYDATSVREIVELAGVTKPTLYYHFGSKQGLGEALLTRPMSEFLARLRGLIDSEGDPVRMLRETFEAHFDFLSSEPDRCRFFYSICFGPNSTSLQEEMHGFGMKMNLLMGDCARKLADAGWIAAGRVEAFAASCRGLIIVSSMDSIFCGQELSPGLAEQFVDDLLHGYGRVPSISRSPTPFDRGQGS